MKVNNKLLTSVNKRFILLRSKITKGCEREQYAPPDFRKKTVDASLYEGAPKSPLSFGPKGIFPE